MAYNYEYPHFDAGNYNADWLINKMKELEETVIGLETFKYIGENEILDLNQQKQNSIAAFTSNFNVLNSPISNVKRVTVTYGSENAYLQQLYDIDNLTIYTRIFTPINRWTTWEMTQNKPGTNLHTTKILQNADLNDLDNNSATYVYGGNVKNCPTRNWGFVITWNSSDDIADKIQLWFDTTNNFCYIRTAHPSWSVWVELNHIDLSEYYRAQHITDLNDLTSPGSAFINTDNVSNSPPDNIFKYYQVFYIGTRDSEVGYQIAFSIDVANLIYTRRKLNTTDWTAWSAVLQNEGILHRSSNRTNADAITAATYSSGNFTSGLNIGSAYIQGIGFSYQSSDTYQIILTSGNVLGSRFRNGSIWGPVAYYQKISSTRSLTITSTAEDHSTDDDGNDRYMMGENIYTEAANSMYNTYISLPGQSLLHSDEGKQSFKDAILTADLSDTDVIMTNLEMWDMDIPIDTIAEEVISLSEAIIAKNPMCELTLLSIPPIDIPLWGAELLDYTMPNGSTIRQLDDRLFRLSEEHAFNYVSFEYFYDAQNANLLQYLGDDFKTNKQYLRRVSTFIKNTM